MTPNFTQLNHSLYHTLTYFKIERIKDQIKKISGVANLNHLDTYYQVALEYHKHMENEINQNIVGSIHYIQLSLFERLRDWLNNWQFNEGFENEIEYLIDKANEDEWLRYEVEIDNDLKEYKKLIPPGVGEGEEYIVEFPEYYHPMRGQRMPKSVEVRINKFGTNKQPDLIDKTYLPDYIKLVKEILNSFKAHSGKYVDNFFAGKYTFNTQIISQPIEKKLSSPPILNVQKKLKTTLTIKQLLYLFKSLMAEGIIEEPEHIKHLHAVIAANFQTERTDDMKIEQLQKKWSEIEAKDIVYWEKTFLTLHKQAIKDNPNKI